MLEPLLKAISGMAESKGQEESFKGMDKALDKQARLIGLQQMIREHPDHEIKSRAMMSLMKESGVDEGGQRNMLSVLSAMLQGGGSPETGGSQEASRPETPTSGLPRDLPSQSLETNPAPTPAIDASSVPSMPTPRAAIEPSMSVQSATPPPPAQPSGHPRLAAIGRQGLRLAGSMLTGGATIEEENRRKDIQTEQQNALERERQQSKLRTQEDIAKEQRARGQLFDPEVRRAKLDDYRQQLEAKGEVDRIEQGRILKQVDDYVQQSVASGTDREDAERQAAERFGLTYHPPTQTTKPFGAQRVKPDPKSSTGYRYYQEFSDGTTKDLEEAPAPASAKTRPKLSGQLGELAEAHQVLDDPKSTKEEKQAATEFLRKQNKDEDSSTGPVIDKKPDPATGNRIIPGTGLTANAVYQSAIRYALTGSMPSLGLGSSGSVKSARDAIINSAASLADQAGVDLPTLQAEYKSNASALTKLVATYNQTQVNEQNAIKNFSLLKDLGKRMDAQSVSSSIPLINSWVRTGQVSLSDNPAVNNFLSVLTTSMTEYAKVVTGQTGGAAVTDSARAETQKLLNQGLSTKTINDWIDNAAVPDMQNRTSSYLDQINKISNSVASFLKGGVVQPTQSTPPPADLKSLPTDELLKRLAPR